jgi:hypothetical protein
MADAGHESIRSSQQLPTQACPQTRRESVKFQASFSKIHSKTKLVIISTPAEARMHHTGALSAPLFPSVRPLASFSDAERRRIILLCGLQDSDDDVTNPRAPTFPDVSH